MTKGIKAGFISGEWDKFGFTNEVKLCLHEDINFCKEAEAEAEPVAPFTVSRKWVGLRRSTDCD